MIALVSKEETITIEPLVNEEELDRIPPGKIVAVSVKTKHVIAYADSVTELVRIMKEKGYKMDDFIND